MNTVTNSHSHWLDLKQIDEKMCFNWSWKKIFILPERVAHLFCIRFAILWFISSNLGSKLNSPKNFSISALKVLLQAQTKIKSTKKKNHLPFWKSKSILLFCKLKYKEHLQPHIFSRLAPSKIFFRLTKCVQKPYVP